MSNPSTLPSDIDYGNTVNGVLYELIDNLTTDNQARIKGRQLIDKALASQVAAAREETVKKFAGLMNEMIDIELDEDNKATMHDCVDNAVYIIREKLKEPNKPLTIKQKLASGIHDDYLSTQIREAEHGGLETPEDTAKPSRNQADNLDEFIRQLEPELRVGGGATLDELYNLAVAVRADIAVTDLATNSPNTNTDLSNPQEQRIAEYKQLLESMPEYRDNTTRESLSFVTPPLPEYDDHISAGFNDCLDQCRAIIQKHIEALQ